MQDTYGGRIRILREKKGLTQQELAERCGVTRTAIVKYETNAIAPNAFVAVAIAEQLGTTVENLVKGA